MSATDEVAALKQRQQATWAAGNYAVVAELLEGVADQCVEAAMITLDVPVLDVATGTGNTAIVAARYGGRVTGLDLTPELFETARRRAGEWGVEVEWVEGDAEALPFEDASFLRVLSTFGVQFAPRHEVVAQELARVCAPGGRIVLCNWCADGLIGEMYELMGRHLPPAPAFATSPALWGDEEHVRSLLEDRGVTMSFERRSERFPFESPAAYIEFFERHSGPTIKAREVLEPQGRWQAAVDEWRGLVERFYEDGDVVQDYLIVTARRR